MAKEAYLQRQNHPEYKEIIKSVSSIIFLATPHRGSNMAQTLNTILKVITTNHFNQLIVDLMAESQALRSLNDRFRHVAPNLRMVSFYETRPTVIGLQKMVVNSLEVAEGL